MRKEIKISSILKMFLVAITVVTGLFMLLLISIPLLLIVGAPEPTGNVAVIKLHGIILVDGNEGIFGDSQVGSSSYVELIRKAEEDDKIKAILLDINSPGGSAVASEEIANAVLKAKKPTIALIRDVGASGAYWVASAADRVIASPVSITGSIGVTASYLEFGGLFDKYDIGYQRLVAGKYKDAGSPFRNLTVEEEKIFQELLDEIHDYFIRSVEKNRGIILSKEDSASGRIFIGAQAKRIGLVDDLGNQERAEEIIKELTDIKEVKTVEFAPKPELFGGLGNFLSAQGREFGKGVVSGAGTPEIRT